MNGRLSTDLRRVANWTPAFDEQRIGHFFQSRDERRRRRQHLDAIGAASLLQNKFELRIVAADLEDCRFRSTLENPNHFGAPVRWSISPGRPDTTNRGKGDADRERLNQADFSLRHVRH